jgi:hypothetical protein
MALEPNESPIADPDTNRAFDELLKQEELLGASVLTEVETFLARFIAYPTEAALIAHVLWVAHTHAMDSWESTPRIAFLSPEPASGKSRALEVTDLLVPRPVHAVNCTSNYLFRKVSDPEGRPTILYDEIDTVFGPKAKENEDLRGLLNAGHRKGAVAGRCVVRGAAVTTEELPAYCAVALAGLDDLPDTIMTRSVVIRMRRRSPKERVDPFRHREHSSDGHAIRDNLADWASTIPSGTWPKMPEEIADRNADVWEALLAVADAAGGEWPERAREAAVTLVTAVTQAPGGLGVQLLADLRTVFAKATKDGQDKLSTETILSKLNAMDESPWGAISHGNPLDPRGLARRLRRYDIGPSSQREGDSVFKGYAVSDFTDAWERYLSPPPPGPGGDSSVTSVTSDTSETTARNRVTDVTATAGRACRNDAPPPTDEDPMAEPAGSGTLWDGSEHPAYENENQDPNEPWRFAI